MYETFYGFDRLPFSLSPNTEFYLPLPGHRACLNLLHYAIECGEGLTKIVGEVGTGKTLLCNQLVKQLKKSNYFIIRLSNPHLTPKELRRLLAFQLSYSMTDHLPEHAVLECIFTQLRAKQQRHKSVILMIDEAQAMPSETLEELRLFSNFETESKKLLQIVLLGQPELDDVLQKSVLRQFQQRIGFSCQLYTLDNTATRQYIEHRIKIAGYDESQVLFHNSTFKLINKYTKGIPRLINIICHKALLAAYGKNALQVNTSHVKQAVRDTESITKQSHLWQRWLPSTTP